MVSLLEQVCTNIPKVPFYVEMSVELIAARYAGNSIVLQFLQHAVTYGYDILLSKISSLIFSIILM